MNKSRIYFWIAVLLICGFGVLNMVIGSDSNYSNLLWGYMDQSGNYVIKPQFRQAADFSEGLAAVELPEKGTWAFIDKKGKIAFTLHGQLDSQTHFSEGLARIVVPGQGVGFVNRSGEWVIKPTYLEAMDFQDGVAAVRVGPKPDAAKNGGKATPRVCGASSRGEFPPDPSRWGYIFHSGEFAITPRYMRAGNFEDAEAIVEDEKGQLVCIDMEGKVLKKSKLSWTDKFSEGLTPAHFDLRYGYLGKDGQVVIPAQFEEAGQFGQGLAGVRLDQTYGYIDREGEMQFSVAPGVPYFWTNVHLQPYSEDLALVELSNHNDQQAALAIPDVFCFINQDGKAVLSPNVDACGSFKNGLARFAMTDRSGLQKLLQMIFASNRVEVHQAGDIPSVNVD